MQGIFICLFVCFLNGSVCVCLCVRVPAFYSSKYGYKMCLRLYLNGDGSGRGTHLSLFFVVMRGKYDALLKWPFSQKVSLSICSRLSFTFTRPSPSSLSFTPSLTHQTPLTSIIVLLHSELELRTTLTGSVHTYNQLIRVIMWLKQLFVKFWNYGITSQTAAYLLSFCLL